MIYWADLLYSAPSHYNEDMSFDQLYSDEPYIEATPGALKSYDDGVLDGLRALIQDAAGGIVDQTRRAFDLDFLAKFFLDKVVRDLSFYYDEDQKIKDRNGALRLARAVLMDELASTLKPLKGREIMVIAHSMGSIIAYDVLRDLGRVDKTFEVANLVTIGSPLGFPTVKANVLKEREGYAGKEAVRTPTIVTKDWTNFSDKKDPVAFDTHLNDDYGPNAKKIQVNDDLVSNDYVGRSGKANHHKSYGYLRTPEMSEYIAKFLQA
ncbi:MAG: alpha/beta hydrolase [Pseudomonadota bacterium]